MTLREKIVALVRNGGPIPFSRYMEICLYDPEMGYYSHAKEQFGKAGDFYTSSDVHAVFGRLLTRQFAEMWQVLGSPARLRLVELGPGRGLFALDVLDWAEKKFPEFFSALYYVLVERSAAFRERLRLTLARHVTIGRVEIRDQVPFTPDVSTLVFGNEFFDALPVEVVSSQGMLCIGEKEGKLREEFHPISPAIDEYLDHYAVRPEGDERVELGLAAFEGMRKIANGITRGFMVFIDYGYAREELLAGRHRGTVMAYRRHSVSENPYEAPGEQDITAHVNFTALAAAAEREKMKAERLLTQSQFLMGIGETNQFADAFEECKLPQERAKVTLQLKHLVTPVGMGESFHVLVGSKGVAEPIRKLSGLAFTRH